MYRQCTIKGRGKREREKNTQFYFSLFAFWCHVSVKYLKNKICLTFIIGRLKRMHVEIMRFFRYHFTFFVYTFDRSH